MKPTLVIGASTEPSRYACRAIKMLRQFNHEVVALGKVEGKIDDVEIVKEWNPDWKVDTVTLYINPKIQENYYQKVIALKPRRVIFNPGTENLFFEGLLKESGIIAEEACTLVLLSIGNY